MHIEALTSITGVASQRCACARRTLHTRLHADSYVHVQVQALMDKITVTDANQLRTAMGGGTQNKSSAPKRAPSEDQNRGM